MKSAGRPTCGARERHCANSCMSMTSRAAWSSASTIMTNSNTLTAGQAPKSPFAALAEAVAHAVGFSGEIVFDTTKPYGTPRKLMD